MIIKMCKKTELNNHRARILRVEGKQIAVYREGENIFAFSPFCPHARANLTRGVFSGHEVCCHWHGWRFDLESGEGLNNDCKLKMYPVSIRDGIVFVDLEDNVPSGEVNQPDDFFMPEIQWKEK
ncbi:MAG: Rieske (2Fe-2S) protein [Acidobacteria bacterium]|nr:Rieske (2Fe-2S) protein [Acidobacteriota bacterium]